MNGVGRERTGDVHQGHPRVTLDVDVQAVGHFRPLRGGRGIARLIRPAPLRAGVAGPAGGEGRVDVDRAVRQILVVPPGCLFTRTT